MCGAPAPVPAEDPNDVEDPLIWSHDLDTYPGGEFSYAVVRAHDAIEDQSLVEIGDGAIFVGVFDGHGGDAASTFVCENLFPIFNSETNFSFFFFPFFSRYRCRFSLSESSLLSFLFFS